MTNQHPITPSPELVKQWEGTAYKAAYNAAPIPYTHHIARCAARWGADMELEACAEWLGPLGIKGGDTLRRARRPKLPSLKEQALRILVENGTTLDGRIELEPEDIPIIRQALETIND